MLGMHLSVGELAKLCSGSKEQRAHPGHGGHNCLVQAGTFLSLQREKGSSYVPTSEAQEPSTASELKPDYAMTCAVLSASHIPQNLTPKQTHT